MYSTELEYLRYCHFYFNRRKYWKGTVLSLPCSLCVALNACFKLRDCAGCITRQGTTGLNYKREMHSGAAPLRECQLFKVLPRQGQGQNNSFYLSATKIPRSFWPQANNLTKFSLKKNSSILFFLIVGPSCDQSNPDQVFDIAHHHFHSFSSIVDLLIWRPWFSSFDLDQTHPRSINEQLRRESATGFGLDTYGIGIRQDWTGGVDLGFHLTLLHRHMWNITWNWIWIRLMDFDGGG